MVMPLPIGHPDAIPAVCAAHISILRLYILQSGLCVTSAAFAYQAANVGQFVPCGIHSACPVLSGGGRRMLADHSRKAVAALSRAIWERKARTMPTKKVGNVPGLFAYSGISMPGSSFAKKAVSTTRQSSPNFINANKKKTRERAQNLRTTVFLYWIKYWLKTLVPVQPPPRVGTATAASRYSHRRL